MLSFVLFVAVKLLGIAVKVLEIAVKVLAIFKKFIVRQNVRTYEN